MQLKPIHAWIATGGALLLAMVSAGCAVEERGKVPVRGRVTLNGGEWPREGTLSFTPASAAPGSDDARNAMAVAPFDKGGRFTVNGTIPGEGLHPGEYLVGVECMDYPPNTMGPGQGPVATSLIPDRFRRPNTSGLKVTVNRGEGGGDLLIDVKTK